MPRYVDRPGTRHPVAARFRLDGPRAQEYASYCGPLGAIGKLWTLEWIEDDPEYPGEHLAEFQFVTCRLCEVFVSSVQLGGPCFSPEDIADALAVYPTLTGEP